MLNNTISYLTAPHKFININSTLPDTIPSNYIRVKYLYCGICGGDFSRYMGYRNEYPISLGHEFVAQVCDYNCSKRINIEKGDFVVSDFNYRCNNCSYCRDGKSHLCIKNNIGLFTNRAFSTYADIHYSYLCKISSSINPIVRATNIEPLSCVLHAIDNYNLSNINRILIYGTGNIGMLCAFFLCKCKGKNVYLYDKYKEKAELIANTLSCSLDESYQNYDLVIEATNTADGLLECISRCKYNQFICSFSHLYGQNTRDIYTTLVRKESNIYFPLRNGPKENLYRATQIISCKWTAHEDRLIKVIETEDLNSAFEYKKKCIEPKQVIKFKV